jgi:hypothetical protein
MRRTALLLVIGLAFPTIPCLAESWGGIDIICNLGPEIMGQSVFDSGAYFRSATGTMLGIEGHGYGIGSGGLKIGGWGGGITAWGSSLPALRSGATLDAVVGGFGGLLIGLSGQADAVVISINGRLGIGALVFIGRQSGSSEEALSGGLAAWGGVDVELGYQVSDTMVVSLYGGVHATAAFEDPTAAGSPWAAPVLGLRMAWLAGGT